MDALNIPRRRRSVLPQRARVPRLLFNHPVRGRRRGRGRGRGRPRGQVPVQAEARGRGQDLQGLVLNEVLVQLASELHHDPFKCPCADCCNPHRTLKNVPLEIQKAGGGNPAAVPVEIVAADGAGGQDLQGLVLTEVRVRLASELYHDPFQCPCPDCHNPLRTLTNVALENQEAQGGNPAAVPGEIVAARGEGNDQAQQWQRGRL